MVRTSDKAKQFLIVTIKVLVVGGAFYVIGQKLGDSKIDWRQFRQALASDRPKLLFSLVVLLAVLNRLLEIFKWQRLASTIRPIGLGAATRQVLGALTAGIFTPNGVGEYAGKALFFEKSQARNIVFLNLVCNGAQMLVTLVLGSFGLLYFNAVHPIVNPTVALWIMAGIVSLLLVLLLVRRISIRGYSLDKALRKLNALPHSLHRTNLALAVGRYACFSHQQYLLLLCFGVALPYPLLMAAIAATYFLASCLPSFQFLDFAVKGGVAVYFFGLLGVDAWIIVMMTTLIWLLNVVLPVVAGSYVVLRFRTP